MIAGLLNIVCTVCVCVQVGDLRRLAKQSELLDDRLLKKYKKKAKQKQADLLASVQPQAAASSDQEVPPASHDYEV